MIDLSTPVVPLNYSGIGFPCTMEGYRDLVLLLVDLFIFWIPLAMQILKRVIPRDLGKMMDHLYYGFTGVNAWIGYAIAAIYFLLLDTRIGDGFCEVSGVLAVPVVLAYKAVFWDDERVLFARPRAVYD